MRYHTIKAPCQACLAIFHPFVLISLRKLTYPFGLWQGFGAEHCGSCGATTLSVRKDVGCRRLKLPPNLLHGVGASLAADNWRIVRAVGVLHPGSSLSVTFYCEMPNSDKGCHFELDASVREALSRQQAKELLEPLKVGISSVKLGGKSFGDGSAEEASIALARAAPTLRNVDIADIIASRPEDEAKRALACFASGLSEAKQLVTIDLSDNAFGLKGIREVQSIISGQESLEGLKLCNNGLAADAGSVIASALTEQTPTKLKLLHFHNNLLESAGAKALAPIVEASPLLEDFRFSALRLHHDGASRICDALSCVPENLKRLNLSDNNFGADGGLSLGSMLMKTRNVEELLLRDCALGDEGISSVCGAIAEGAGRRMKILDLSGNEISAKGARALKKCLQGCPVLTQLLIEDNELGSSGARSVASCLDAVIHADLAVIVAACSEIGTKGALALASAAVQLPGLESLNLNGNTINADAVADIKSLLDGKLESLSENDDDDEDDGDDEDESEVTSEDGSSAGEGCEGEQAVAGERDGRPSESADVDGLASAVGSLSVGTS